MNLETLQNLSPYIRVSCKFVLKSVKSSSQILWVIKYWFRVLECQTCWTNTKLFFWETIGNLETLEKLFSYIWLSYKFVLKSSKRLTRIFFIMEYWFKAIECQSWLTNTRWLFWENEAKCESQTLQKFLPILDFPINFFWCLSKP